MMEEDDLTPEEEAAYRRLREAIQKVVMQQADPRVMDLKGLFATMLAVTMDIGVACAHQAKLHGEWEDFNGELDLVMEDVKKGIRNGGVIGKEPGRVVKLKPGERMH